MTFLTSKIENKAGTKSLILIIGLLLSLIVMSGCVLGKTGNSGNDVLAADAKNKVIAPLQTNEAAKTSNSQNQNASVGLNSGNNYSNTNQDSVQEGNPIQNNSNSLSNTNVINNTTIDGGTPAANLSNSSNPGNSNEYPAPLNLGAPSPRISNIGASSNTLSASEISQIDEANNAILGNTATTGQLITRRRLMKEALVGNAELFFEKSIVATDTAYAETSVDMEQPIELDGYLNILVSENANGNPDYSYSIISNGKKYNLNPTSTLLELNPDLRSGSHVRLTGLALDDSVAVKTSDVQILSNGPTDSIGPQKIAVFLLSFTDSTYPNPENFTPSYVKDRLENGPFAKFMQEQSYGKVGAITADVYGWYQVPHAVYLSGSTCIPPSLDEIKAYSDSIGIDMTQYRRILVLVNHQCFTGGTSYVGISLNNVGGEIWNTSVSWVGNININNQSTYNNPSGWGSQPFNWTNFDYLVSHELGGHGFGANHAGIMRCEPGVTMYGQYCNENNLQDPYQTFNYGNYYDVMGTTSFTLHTNAYYKEMFGWIPSANIQSVTNDGTYTINPLESNSGIHAAKIYPKGSDPNTAMPYMYLEIRRPIGFDGKMNYSTSGWPNTKDNLNGIFVNVMNEFFSSDQNFARTYLLDMTPNSVGGTSASYYDTMNVSLNVGRTYIDEPMGIRIKTLAVDNTSATFETTLTQPSCYFREPIKIPADTSRVSMSMHRPVYNLFNFGYTFQGKAYAGCTESHILLEPNYPAEWNLEYFEKLPSGEMVQFFDKTITLDETSSKNIVVYAQIPRSWLKGTTKSFAPTMNITEIDFNHRYNNRLILSQYTNVSFGNDSCITREPIFKGVLSYAVNPGQSFIMPVTVRNNDSSSCQDSVFTYNVTVPEGWTAVPYYNNSYLYNATFINQTTGEPYNRTVVGYRLERWYNKYVRRNTNSELILFYNVTPTAIPGNYEVQVNFTNYNGQMRISRQISVALVDPCIRNLPSLDMPSSTLFQQGVDNSAFVMFNVTNNDNAYCAQSVFNITTTNTLPYSLYELQGANYVAVAFGISNITAGAKKQFAYNITTTSYANTSFGVTAKNTNSGLSATANHQLAFYDSCVRDAPAITMASETLLRQRIDNDTLVFFNVTNNDNSYCANSQFDISATNPLPYKTYEINGSAFTLIASGQLVNMAPGSVRKFAFNVTTASYLNTTFGTTARNTVSGLSATANHAIKFYDPCVRAAPDITIDTTPHTFIDTRAGVTAGTSSAYVKNNDNAYCAQRNFTINIAGYPGWTYTQKESGVAVASSFALVSGQSKTREISFVANQNNLIGAYDTNVSVIENGATLLKRTIPITASVSPPIVTMNMFFDNIYVNNNAPRVGQQIGVNFVIMKNEQTTINNFKYTINTGEQIITRTVSAFDYPIDAWEYFSYTKAGSFNGNITLDPDNSVAETNEGDNVILFTINPTGTIAGKMAKAEQ